MQTPDLSCLELRESQSLPARTLVAPISVIREIRLLLGQLKLDLRVGLGETVLISSDLYAAFNAWQAENFGNDDLGNDDDDVDAEADISNWN